MKEHRKEVEQQEGRKYTRSTKRQSQSKQNKSAITDHVNTDKSSSGDEIANVKFCTTTTYM